jgi:hypothetical protein
MCAETEPTKPRAALDPSGEDKTTSFPESDTISLAFSPKSLLEVEEEEEDDQEDEHDVVLSTEPAQAENASMASSGLNYFQPDEHKQEWENLGIPMNCAPTGGFPICHSQLLEEQIEFMTVRTVAGSESTILVVFFNGESSGLNLIVFSLLVAMSTSNGSSLHV